MVGRALMRLLQANGHTVLTAPRETLDLTNRAATLDWMGANKPDVVFMAAAKVGGIGANIKEPVTFVNDNLSIALNVLAGAHQTGVQKLLYLGSSCIYPRDARQPLRETDLMTGRLEPTNEPYAMAKLAGISLVNAYRRQYGCCFISALPTNLYGPFDRFDPQNGHVIPAMMAKFHTAKMNDAPAVILWGSGAPMREFLHVDDLAIALLHLMERYDGETPVNIGSGEEVSIKTLSTMMAQTIGYHGDVHFDSAYPDGTPRKLLDRRMMDDLGWRANITLADGLLKTYEWYRAYANNP